MDWTEVGLSALIGGIIGGGIQWIASLVFKNHPDKEKKLKISSTVSIALVVLAVNAGFGKYVRSLLSPTYRAQQIMGAQIKEVFEHPDIKEKFASDPEAAKAQGFMLAQSGIKHLTLAELDRWHALRLKVATNHQAFCIGLLTGQVTEDDAQSGLATLSDQELEEFGKLLATGIRRKINKEGDPDTHMTYLTTAIQGIVAAMPEDERTKLVSAMQGQGKPEELCWASQVLMNGLATVPDDEREKVLKASSGMF